MTTEFIEIRNKIIEYIKRNRVSTTEVADCMGKSGCLKGIKAVNRGHFVVGPVKWVYAYNESNWSVHEQVIDVKKGEIVYIDAFDCGERAIIGELVTKYMLVYRQGAALICNANLRDANDLIKENYSVWCTGFNPEGCFNNKIDEPLSEEYMSNKDKFDGSIIVADDTGVVLITKNYINEEFMDKLISIEAQEDMWFQCLDHNKWNTYEIVCLKKYNH